MDHTPKARPQALRLCCGAVPWRPLVLQLRKEALLMAAEELLPRPWRSTPEATGAQTLLAAYVAPRLRLERPAPTCQVGLWEAFFNG